MRPTIGATPPGEFKRQKMINHLSGICPYLLRNHSGVTAWLTGDILLADKFGTNSDIVVHLIGAGVEFIDLEPFLEKSIEFQEMFGYDLVFYPADWLPDIKRKLPLHVV